MKWRITRLYADGNRREREIEAPTAADAITIYQTNYSSLDNGGDERFHIGTQIEWIKPTIKLSNVSIELSDDVKNSIQEALKNFPKGGSLQ